jgi:signal transduction histidine kinase
MHGGRISVESAHQRGTTVTVSLPHRQELAGIGQRTG